jgi:hypothetical protein
MSHFLNGADDLNTTTNSKYIVCPTSIRSISIDSGGSIYTNAATQIVISDGGGTGAVVSCTTSSGAINAFTIVNKGIVYTGPPNVIITSGIVNTSSSVGGTGYVLANTQINISGGSNAVITPTIDSGIITAQNQLE